MPTCVCCGTTDQSHKFVNCCVCNKPFKIECVDVSSSEARKIHMKSGITWTCKSCIQMGSDLNSLKSAIVSLQNEIKVLKQSVSGFTNSKAPSLVDTETIIQEIYDRERRKNSVVIFGSTEATCNTNNEQLALDKTVVLDMCSAVQIDTTNMKLSRLGRFDSAAANRCRPIKVSFSSESAVHTILRNISKIKALSQFSKLSIYRDRTPMQLQLHRDARTEMDIRMKTGESNLKIKYKKGLPTIVNDLN